MSGSVAHLVLVVDGLPSPTQPRAEAALTMEPDQFELNLGILLKSAGRPVKIVTEDSVEVNGLLAQLRWDGPTAIVEIPLQPQVVIPPV